MADIVEADGKVDGLLSGRGKQELNAELAALYAADAAETAARIAADAAMLHIDGTTAGNHNRMTLLNGASGTGGERGDVVRLTDYKADAWMVEGVITAPAGAIAVFSAF